MEETQIIEPIPPPLNDPSVKTYQNKVLCVYHFKGLRNTYVTFRIVYVDLEENFDFLLFGNDDNPSDSRSIFAKLTGKPIIRTMTSISLTCWMTFTTDAQGVAKGYQIIVALIPYEGLTGKFQFSLIKMTAKKELKVT